MSRRITLGLATTALTFGVVACGDDDDGASDTTAPSAPTEATPTTAATDTTEEATDTSGGEGAGEGDVEAFCQAEVEMEAAFQSEDPAAIGPASEAAIAAAPEEIRGALETALAAAAEDSESPEFVESYGEVIQYMKDNCGFTELDVETADYSFTGLPTEVAAGPAIITMDNIGEEFHQVLFYRVNDDATETLDELLALPEEEALSKLTPKGGPFGAPGAISYGTVNLDEAGRYIAICELPEGMTPEALEEAEATEGSEPEGSAPEGSAPEGDSPFGPPHFTLGMVQEMTVT